MWDLPSLPQHQIDYVNVRLLKLRLERGPISIEKPVERLCMHTKPNRNSSNSLE